MYKSTVSELLPPSLSLLTLIYFSDCLTKKIRVGHKLCRRVFNFSFISHSDPDFHISFVTCCSLSANILMRGFSDISVIVKKSTLEICVCAQLCLCSCKHLCHMTVDGAVQQKLIVSNVTSLSPPPQAGSIASQMCVREEMGQKSRRLFE